MQTERLRELASSRAWAAREAAEEAQLVRSGQSLEGPEAGRKRHQRDGGRKLRRGNRLIDRPQLCLARDRSLARDRTGLASKRRARSSALEVVEHGAFLSVDGWFAASSCAVFLAVAGGQACLPPQRK